MADTEKHPEVELKDLAIGLKKASDDARAAAEKYAGEVKTLGDVTAETKAAADKALTEMHGIAARLTDIEQKVARRGSPSADQMKTMGETVVDNEGVKNLMALKHGQVRVTMERKDITTAPATLGAGVSPTTSLVVADRVPGLIGLPLRPMVVRDLLTPGATISNNIEYVLETDNPFTTAAAVVSEGTTKPETNLTFNMMSAPVRTIAHFSRASRQIMDDAPQLQSFIDGRLRYGLQFAEEGEMLNGNGTGNHLNGIIPQAAAYSAAFSPPSETDIDRIRMALLQATLAYYPSTGVVLHPTDWAKMEMAKDTLGRYIIGDPQGTTAPRLWGLPVVATQAMVATHFLVGAFKLGAQIFDRMSIEVLISTEDANNFTQNMISIRAEERLALVVYRPNAFVTGTLPV